MTQAFSCRAGCGACCIAPAISSPIPGMPQGKPAGVPCVHLTSGYQCALFGDPARPAVCSAFAAEPDLCGNDRSQALRLLGDLEADSRPGSG